VNTSLPLRARRTQRIKIKGKSEDISLIGVREIDYSFIADKLIKNHQKMLI
jgi:hypothetical protein